MGRTIDLDAALDALTDYCENKCVNREDAWCSGCHYGISEYVLNALPSAQPEQKVGKWMAQNGGGYRCSECGRYALDEIEGNFVHVAARTPYCPFCGKKMEEE